MILPGFASLISLANLLLWYVQSPGIPASIEVRVATFVPVLCAAGVWVLGRYFGVTLTAEAAIVHNVRRRTIPWNRVAAVKVENFSGGRRIVLYEADGRRTPLRMPSTGYRSRDRHFEEKAATIRDWWFTHRQREGQADGSLDA
jgi:hypothetical protein